MTQLKVTQIRSAIRPSPSTADPASARSSWHRPDQRAPDRPEIHGMIARVPHLIKVEEVNE